MRSTTNGCFLNGSGAALCRVDARTASTSPSEAGTAAVLSGEVALDDGRDDGAAAFDGEEEDEVLGSGRKSASSFNRSCLAFLFFGKGGSNPESAVLLLVHFLALGILPVCTGGNSSSPQVWSPSILRRASDTSIEEWIGRLGVGATVLERTAGLRFLEETCRGGEES